MNVCSIFSFYDMYAWYVTVLKKTRNAYRLLCHQLYAEQCCVSSPILMDDVIGGVSLIFRWSSIFACANILNWGRKHLRFKSEMKIRFAIADFDEIIKVGIDIRSNNSYIVSFGFIYSISHSWRKAEGWFSQIELIIIRFSICFI